MPAVELLPDNSLFKRNRSGAARWALHPVPELPDINLELVDCAAEGVAVHSQFSGGTALVTLVFLQNGQDETLLELPHAFRVEDIAAVHLQNECFQLIFHDASLSMIGLFNAPLTVCPVSLRLPGPTLRSLMNESQALIEASAQL
jgi:hypothetical protein